MRPWLNEDEAATWLQVTIPAVRLIARRKRWPTTTRNGTRIYRTNDVATEVERRATPSPLRRLVDSCTLPLVE